ncbi:MAG: phage tail sheath subtilisin-like domain-containing protein [Actinomycetota bacterium]|nr:phage tail sheath subtilisin-like domain-containing protein [Actinomycetota bacterium]
MPEYLAPGVYVEEVDTGAKPIEGVSTSTCGMVGVAERGPVDVPVLVTSVGDYSRWFGGRLRRGDDYGDHCYLPHAVEGFFTNGGKRVYVVRTIDAAASRASASLFDRGDPASETTTLLRSAGEGTGSAAGPPDLIVLPTGLGVGDWVRIGEGSTAEYREVDAASAPDTKFTVALDLPLTRSHRAGDSAREYAHATTDTYTTLEDLAPGDVSVVVQAAHARIASLATDAANTALTTPVALELGATGVAEYRVVREVTEVTVVSGTDSTALVRFDAAAVLPYPKGATFERVNFTGTVNTATLTSATAGSAVVYVDDRGGDFVTTANLAVVGNSPTWEVRQIGQLTELNISPGAAGDYESGSLLEVVAPTAERSLASAATAPTTTLTLGADQTAGLVLGQVVVLDPSGAPQSVTITRIVSGTTLEVTPFPTTVAVNKEVVPAAKKTTGAALAGTTVLALDDRMGLAAGSLVRVGSGVSSQVVEVTSVPGLTGMAPDPGNVVVSPRLAGAVAVGTPVTILRPVEQVSGRQATALALPAETGTTVLHASDGHTYALNDLVRVTTLGGDVSFHTLQAAPAAAVPDVLRLKTALARSHAAGAQVVQRSALVTVEALDAGSWGNRLRLGVTDDDPGLVSRTTLGTLVNPTTIRLASRSGVQPGTVLEFADPSTGAVLGDPVKVRSVDRSTGNILLAGAGLSAAQQLLGTVVRSREFTVTVSLLRQPDPATPSRDGQVIDREVFRQLSLDPRHSNYIAKVIGDTTGPLRKWDRRPEGGSLYIRVHDPATGAAAEEVRLGPETLVDVLPDGRRTPALLRLEEVTGDDSIGSLTDGHYLGSDNADPELRTGLQCLRNIEEVSIVAVPGRVSAHLQQGVIDHCELMRYRFAVLDSRPEPTDTLADALDQRQQFDTKYAAMYYPWLSIPDPFPENIADVRDYPIPPTGHLLGVYARTDVERGVHKAPANEIVRGITGLRRRVNKEQQDILNPYPVNINVIRDFRDNNRGIRVYGGRVITSDPDWKYVNVRRLMIFIEASIERGLQWVVFEPNSEPLWARVQRVISNFLTVVWRSGALEGVEAEEAFFVRCDRTTMTQTDIDNGRLIVQVGVAPVKPAEFVIVRIGLWTARSES